MNLFNDILQYVFLVAAVATHIWKYVMLIRILNSSGMCHSMPHRHLPEWREEEERAFVHRGSSGLNHAIACNWVCHRAFQSVICHFTVTSCKCSWQWLAYCCVQAFMWYPTATVYKCPFLLSPLWQMLFWHQVAHATAIPSGMISLCILDEWLVGPKFIIYSANMTWLLVLLMVPSGKVSKYGEEPGVRNGLSYIYMSILVIQRGKIKRKSSW